MPEVEIVACAGVGARSRAAGPRDRDQRVDTIYHAAAYKHVPIVEGNPVTGLRNNTWHARRRGDGQGAGCRPRRADLNRQGRAPDQHHGRQQAPGGADPAGTGRRRRRRDGLHHGALRQCPRLLRFRGAPLRKQIREGGPITVTHPTSSAISCRSREAGQLVIQAGAMAEGGDVFVLDMGTPVKIDDLARTMILCRVSRFRTTAIRTATSPSTMSAYARARSSTRSF